jgi:hypothetical protein
VGARKKPPQIQRKDKIVQAIDQKCSHQEKILLQAKQKAKKAVQRRKDIKHRRSQINCKQKE